MTIKIKSTKDVSADGANIVIYGNSGIGKTKLIVDLTNVIVLSADRGLLTLKKYDIPYIEIANMEDINEAYEHVRKSDYDHIVLDSLTEMAEVALFKYQRGLEKAGKGKDKRQAYGILADAFGVMIRKFRDIQGKNTIFMAKQKNIYEKGFDNEEALVGYEPMMPGRVLPHGLPYLTDEVFAYVMDKKKQRYFITSAQRKYPAKDRSGNLNEKEYDPNLNDIINRVLSIEEK